MVRFIFIYKIKNKMKEPAHPNLIKEYFKNIDNKNKAYWLGFLYADGYINKYRLSIDLKLTDKIILEKFCKDTGANINKLKIRQHKKGYKSIQLRITSKEFVSNIINKGCFNNKSKNIRLPIFDTEEINLSFLMGYYDGDGFTTYICSGSFEFLNDIKLFYNIDSNVKLKKSVYILNLKTNFKNKLNNNYTDSLERKRDIKTKTCECGNKIDKKSNMCYQCSNLKRRKVKNRPSTEELLVMINNIGLEGVGRIYGVCGNSVKKWIK